MQLKESDIKRSVDPGTFARGKAYFQQRRVVEIEETDVSGDVTTLMADVEGSGNYLYGQRIRLHDLGSQVMVEGTCSCPVSYNCKHVVAALFAFLENDISAVDRATAKAMSWLAEVAQAQDRHLQVESEERLFYILDYHRSTAELTVEARKVKRLKSGKWSRGRTLNLEQALHFVHRPDYMRAEDLPICIGMHGLPGFNRVHLSGLAGSDVLHKVLASGRGRWADTDGFELIMGDQRRLLMDWQDVSMGKKLQLSVEGGGLVVKMDPPMYLDVEQEIIGLLDAPNMNEQKLAALLAAPVVPEIAQKELGRILAIERPDLAVPPLIDISDVLIEQPARAYLQVLQYSGDDTQHMDYYMMLQFDYGQYRIDALPVTAVSVLPEGDDLISIKRDLSAEQTFKDQLLAYDFDALEVMGKPDLYFASMPVEDHHGGLQRWAEFLQHGITTLRAQGWTVDIAAGFSLDVYEFDDFDANVTETGDWLDLRFDIKVDGKSYLLLPLVAQAIANFPRGELPEVVHLKLKDNKFLALPRARLEPILAVLYELYDQQSLDDGVLRLPRQDATRIAELQSYGVRWQGGEKLIALGEKLRTMTEISPVAAPQGLNATLRDYQQQGLAWMQFLGEFGFSGILADDMGLGKTVQTLAHLLLEKQQGRLNKPALVIAPTSLVSNWRREAALFTPDLKVLVLQGPKRSESFHLIADADMVISSYALLVRDADTLYKNEFSNLVLDEAQNIKNPRTKASKVLRGINTQQRLALSGTPMENHLGELWAIFDFLMPGFLGDSSKFTRNIRTPIEKDKNTELRDRLAKRIAPFMLRRTKAEVVAELPPKTEMIRSVPLGTKQAAVYESIRLSMEKKVKKSIQQHGLARSHITILDALLKLRQVCCEPSLVQLKAAQDDVPSAKLEMLMEMVPELLEEGRRILIFSQFAKMLVKIGDELSERQIPFAKLTGQTRKRDEAIDEFKNGKADVFLISLKAGGVGLNLTEADTVIHYDPWWNPAVEAQASDRAYRIGQDKPVFVYKLICEATLEEKILKMQARKKELADGVYKGGKSDGDSALILQDEDLDMLLSPLS